MHCTSLIHQTHSVCQNGIQNIMYCISILLYIFTVQASQTNTFHQNLFTPPDLLYVPSQTLKLPSSGSFHRATPPALSGFPGQMTPGSASQFHFQQAGSLSHAKHLISVTTLTSCHRSQCYKDVHGKGIFPCSHGVLSSVIAEINHDTRVSRHYNELST